MKKLILILAIVCGSLPMLAERADSAQKVAATKKSSLRFQTRLHSLGVFYYGGRIVSTNFVADFNLTYDRKTWGLQIFKALDLKNSNTPLNFTLAVVNKNFRFGKRLTITPAAGFLFEQQRGMADHGSDVVGIVTTGFKLTDRLTIDHSALFGNLFLATEHMDWVNRFRLLYSHKHLDVTAWAWHNNTVLDEAEYTTYGLSIFRSRMKISDHTAWSAGVTALVMPYSNDENDIPKRNGILVTLACVLH